MYMKIAKNSSLLGMAVRAESAVMENFMQFETLNLDNYNLKIIVNTMILNAGFYTFPSKHKRRRHGPIFQHIFTSEAQCKINDH